MRLPLFLVATILGAVFCHAGSVGVYAPALKPGIALSTNAWSKYSPAAVGPLTSARIQAFHDMMCERVDLMDPDYSYAPDKTGADIPGCPSPEHRAALADSGGAFTEALYAQLYGDMCAWLARDPTVVTSEAGENEVFPYWQSPLCRDIRFEATPGNIVSHNVDTYPCSLSRFGVPQQVRTDTFDALTDLADRLGTVYVAAGAGVNVYTVTFSANGATGGSVPSPVSGYTESTFSVPGRGTLKRDGHDFTGWTDLSGRVYAEGSMYTIGRSNDVLSATWAIRGIAEALGCPGVVFTGGGNSSFYVDDSGRVRSGVIGDGQHSSLITVVEGPKAVTFEWHVSSEPNYDFFEFYVGSTLNQRICGTDGGTVLIQVPAGTHQLEWRYMKDGSQSRGEDCGWLVSMSFADATSLGFRTLDNPGTEIDKEFCGFYDTGNPVLRFVDEIGPGTEEHDRIAWAQLYAFDHICADLASRNVALVDLAPVATYEGRTRRSTYSYRFDLSEVGSWLAEYGNLNNHWEYAPKQTFLPHLIESGGETTTNYVLSVPWASAAVDPGRPVAPSGRITYRGNYVLEKNDSEFYEYDSGETPDGLHYTRYHKYSAYGATAVKDNPQIAYSDTPRCDIAVTAEDVFINVGSNEIHAANRAFSDVPGYFKAAKLTCLAASVRTLFVPAEGVTSTNYELAVAVTSAPSATVTAEAVGAFAHALRVQDSEIESFDMSPGGLTFSVVPVEIAEDYVISEYKTVLGNGITKTIACRDDGGDHWPVYDGHGGLNGPDASRGETYPSANYNGRKIPFSAVATFTTAYAEDRTHSKGSIIKRFSDPVIVCENEYDFTEWSGHTDGKAKPALDLLGPQADYGDGDGTKSDFDALVGDVSGIPLTIPRYADIDAAIAAVDPSSGTHPVTERIAKIAVGPGTYEFPTYFDRSDSRPAPYSVRIIGVGTSTVLHKTKRGGGYDADGQRSWLENVTIRSDYVSTGSRRSLCGFCLVNCTLTGEEVNNWFPFLEASYAYKCLFTNLTTYVTSSSSLPIFIYGSTIEDCAFFCIKNSRGSVTFDYCSDIYDSFVSGGAWKRIYGEERGVHGIMEYTTFHDPDLESKDSLPATNCLFFVDGLRTDDPGFWNNVLRATAEYDTILDKDTLMAKEAYRELWSYGYHSDRSGGAVAASATGRPVLRSLAASGSRPTAALVQPRRRQTLRCMPPPPVDLTDKEDKE